MPESQTVAAGVDGDESFLQRVIRQASDAKVCSPLLLKRNSDADFMTLQQDFPHYLITFIRRFVTGSYDISPTPIPHSHNLTMPSLMTLLMRDSFGMNKIIVAATRRGSVFGLDSATGQVIWKRILGLGWAAKVGARHVPLKMFEVAGVEEAPRIVLVTQRLADNVRSDLMVTALTRANNFEGTCGHCCVPYRCPYWGRRGWELRSRRPITRNRHDSRRNRGCLPASRE